MADALLSLYLYNHVIDLNDSKQPSCGPIYTFLEVELKALRE
jgi:hypothetical protein